LKDVDSEIERLEQKSQINKPAFLRGDFLLAQRPISPLPMKSTPTTNETSNLLKELESLRIRFNKLLPIACLT
jgi:hypothetical protein